MVIEETQAEMPTKLEDVTIAHDYPDETVGIKEYSVSSYGIDFAVEGYVRRLQNGDIRIPEYQRMFIWDQKRASRFIESLLLDLPVPGIFLYRDRDSEILLVVDGQQRLQTLRFFYEGRFADTGRIFALTGLETRFNGLTYEKLDIADRRRLDNSLIRATVIRQDKPDDEATSQYFVFERLNTGGVALSSQEIRAAIYGGKFNELLHVLNGDRAWRTLYGKKQEDKRKRDEELILRFLALYYDYGGYSRPMKTFLNRFMKENRGLHIFSRDQIVPLFTDTVNCILDKLGRHAFKPTKSLNAALLDSLMIGIARRLQSRPIASDINEDFKSLRDDSEFLELISYTTSDPERVRRRIELATEAFANVE
ncbi:MAG: DUF262 domain-containing protein [Chloroflexi bacterium]|nr:DUF262 domain-containing protein [Chloroflexota bacterium]